jgi:hypothetical protein
MAQMSSNSQTNRSNQKIYMKPTGYRKSLFLALCIDYAKILYLAYVNRIPEK